MDIPNYIKERYEAKKESCKERLIPFEFTLEEFYNFHKLRDKVNCFYSGRKFTSATPRTGCIHDTRPTIERLEDSGPYSLDNCVWVTATSNRLKNDYIALCKEVTPSDQMNHQSTINRIKKILSNPSVLEREFQVYKDYFDNLSSHNLEAAKAHRERLCKLKEVWLCDMYSKFGKLLIEDLGADFDMSFSDYKKAITIKRCKLTKKELPEDVRERTLWIKDKRLTIDTDNVLCTTKKVADALDRFSVEADLSYEQICKLFKNLSNEEK